MLRNRYLTKVWNLFGFWLWWEGQIGGNHLLALFFWLSHGFLHNYLVHCAVEVKFDLKEDVCSLNILFLFEFTRSSGHFHNS